MHIVPRHIWNARPPVHTPDIAGWNAFTVNRIHHSADYPDNAGNRFSKRRKLAERAHMRKEQNFHIDSRGWNDIAYNFAIFPSGRVYRARGENIRGAHTLNHNDDIGICFIGNFETQHPTRAAIRNYNRLIARNHRRFGVSTRAIAHCRTFATSCPGKFLRAALRLPC